MYRRKVTEFEWNSAREWLETGAEGSYAENAGRRVEVVNMCGGRYLLYEFGEVAGLTDEIGKALVFLCWFDVR